MSARELYIGLSAISLGYFGWVRSTLHQGTKNSTNAHKLRPLTVLEVRERSHRHGHSHRLGTVCGSQLSKDSLQMVLSGAGTYMQLAGDLLVGVPPRNQPQNFHLPRRERPTRGRIRSSSGGNFGNGTPSFLLFLVREAKDHLPSDLLVKRRLPLKGPADCVEHLWGGRGLEDEARGARPKRLSHMTRLLGGGDH
jgi:hypothetical protein